MFSMLATSAANAQTARGTMIVSTTVLTSCELHAPGTAAGVQPPDAATFRCPESTPFRASLAHDARTGMVAPGGDAGLALAGVRHVTLSQLADAANANDSGKLMMLTISY